MTEQEFETIIKPLMLLDGKQCQFMRSALLGNFKKWNENKQLIIADVVVPKGTLCECGNKELPQYSPCCSLKCWHDQFD